MTTPSESVHSAERPHHVDQSFFVAASDKVGSRWAWLVVLLLVAVQALTVDRWVQMLPSVGIGGVTLFLVIEGCLLLVALQILFRSSSPFESPAMIEPLAISESRMDMGSGVGRLMQAQRDIGACDQAGALVVVSQEVPSWLSGVERTRIQQSVLQLLKEFEALNDCPTGGIQYLDSHRYAVVLLGVVDPSRALAYAQAMIAYLRESHRDFSLPIFAGVAVAPMDHGDKGLLEAAHSAVEAARCNPSGVARYGADFSRQLGQKQQLMTEMPNLFVNDQLCLYLQPQVDMRNGTIVGAEALVRWKHPTRGTLGPAEFFPLLEASGLMPSLDRWVVASACRQLAQWTAEGLSHLSLSINVSPSQLTEGQALTWLEDAVREHGVSAERLELELTECEPLADSATANMVIDRLKQMGVSVALDDFGTGYAAFQCLGQLNLDTVKLDRNLVREVGSSSTQAILVGGVVEMAKRLGLRVVCEGVETEVQRVALQQLGCAVGQGYLWSAPVSSEDFTRLCHLHSRWRAKRQDPTHHIRRVV